MRSVCLDGAALVIPATARAEAEVVRKSRREGLMAKRYEIALGSQAEFAIPARRSARLPREAHGTFHHAAAEGEIVDRKAVCCGLGTGIGGKSLANSDQIG